jgi:hypothetical protein
MAKIAGILDLDSYEGWVASRPPIVQEVIKKYPPNLLYRLTTTDQIVTIYSYSEDGTVTVDVDHDLNPDKPAGVTVFGIDPDDLVECDIPDYAKHIFHTVQ